MDQCAIFNQNLLDVHGIGHGERIPDRGSLIRPHFQSSNAGSVRRWAGLLIRDLLAIPGDHVIHRFKCRFERDRLILRP